MLMIVGSAAWKASALSHRERPRRRPCAPPELAPSAADRSMTGAGAPNAAASAVPDGDVEHQRPSMQRGTCACGTRQPPSEPMPRISSARRRRPPAAALEVDAREAVAYGTLASAARRGRRATGSLDARAASRRAREPGSETVTGATPARVPAAVLSHLAEAAADGRGVWGRDATAAFLLADQDSIGPDGQLILPKLGGRTRVHLSDLVEQRNRSIAFTADVLDIVFVEK